MAGASASHQGKCSMLQQGKTVCASSIDLGTQNMKDFLKRF